MESLSPESVRCLGSRLDELEYGSMFTPILRLLVQCLTPQEIARSQTYVPPDGGPPRDRQFVCNDDWYASIEAMLDHFGVSVQSLGPQSAVVAADSGAGIRFVERGSQAGIAFKHSRSDAMMNLGGGAAAGDFNGDGRLDVYATNSRGPNALYRNNGDGTFTDVAAPAGVADANASSNGAGWADFDNDHDLDLFVASQGASKLFRNDGPSGGQHSFTDITAQSGVGDPDERHRTMGVAWGDYNNDGFLDLLVVRHLDEDGGKLSMDAAGLAKAARPLALYRNRGDGTFDNVTSLLGSTSEFPSSVMGAGFKPGFLDYDDDGDMDIYVVNDFGAVHHPNVLWRNDGDSSSGETIFTDVSESSGSNLSIFGMGLATGDYDNDGDLDLYMTDIGAAELLENQGNGTFINRTERSGTGRGSIPENWFDGQSVSWAAIFQDLDNDGYLDLYVVAGQIDHDLCFNMLNQPNALFANNGDGTFADVSQPSGTGDPGIGRGAAYGDFNGDGRTDLFVVNMGNLDGTPGTARLFENVSENNNHWLDVKTVGTRSNRDGIGTRVKLTVGSTIQIREMGSSQSHMSHSVVPMHFGLGTADRVDSLEVRWPSGEVRRFEDVAADQTLTVTEP